MSASRLRVGVVFCALSGWTGPALAQERILEQDGIAIELEELLSDKGTFRLEFGTTFASSRQDGISGLYQTIQTGAGDFVSLPVELGVTDRTSDTILATFGLRYGLTAKSELYSRLTLRHDEARFVDTATGQTETLSDSALQSLVLGANYRFQDEGAGPGLIGFADVAALENTAARGTDFASGTSGTLGFTAYRVLDPLVLSVTAGYRASFARDTGADRVDPGDIFFINPSIGFAVNNEVTLTGGIGLNFVGDDRVNGTDRDTGRTDAELQFGLAYAWDKNTTLRADARTEVLGDRSFTAGITVTRKFDRK
jgi:hypothetical protein